MKLITGQKLWKDKAISVIPGGNGLLSKRPERYAPDIGQRILKKVLVFKLQIWMTTVLLTWRKWGLDPQF